MAARNFAHKRTHGREYVDIDFSFAPADTGAPTDLRGKGVTSVTRENVGEFLVTFDDTFARLISVAGSVQLAATADFQLQFGAMDLSAKTLVVRTQEAGVDADIAANANNRVNVRVVFQNQQME